MNEQWIPVVVAAISVLGGAGFWSWMQKKSQLAHDKEAALDVDRSEFRESLKAQVDALHKENRELREKVEQLLERVGELQADLSAARVTINHLEQRLMSK